jgi:phosphate uptake regulator
LREVDILADELEERALAALSSPGPTPDPVGEASRALRTASLLEQVASCAASIDSAARSLASKRPSKLPKDLGEMARVALGLLDGALLPAGGWELARSQRERDLLKQVARLSESLSLECFQRMASDPSAIPACKCHLLVARKLEIVANAAAETARLGDTG